MTDRAQKISAERQEPTYYAMIPKMASLDLNPYELALYCNYKQTTGEHGTCTKSNATLAAETRMSVTRMKTARAALVKKGYIRVHPHKDAEGFESAPPTIVVRDVWALNHQIYSTQKALGGVSPHDTPLSSHDTPRRQKTGGVSPHDTKEEPDKKNNTTTSAPKNGAGEAQAKPKKTRAPDAMFDAVAFHVFGIDDPQAEGGRIAKISNWLKGKYEGAGAQKVGKISHPAEVKHIQAFAASCKQKGLTPPYDFVKFVEQWRKWASAAALPTPEAHRAPDALRRQYEEAYNGS